MSNYIKNLPIDPSFIQKGLNGYTYNNIDSKNITIAIEDCHTMHDKYIISEESTFFYYVLNGNGKFCINNDILEVKKDDLIEIPPFKEFTFIGNMRLLVIETPPFNPLTIKETKENDLI